MIRYLTIRTEGTFDAAHRVPGETKCNNLHGHTWRVELELVGVDHVKFRMMVDFIDLKAVMDRLDHINLNEHFKQPTAENLARYFALKFWRIANAQYPFILSVKVKVWESSKSWAQIDLNREELTVFPSEGAGHHSEEGR